ncbi:MAG: hypothetical protein R2741_02410 [Methanolobus sp.]
MADLISTLMTKEDKSLWDVQSIRHGLYMHHSLDSFAFEIAQPGRLPEILKKCTAGVLYVQ